MYPGSWELKTCGNVGGNNGVSIIDKDAFMSLFLELARSVAKMIRILIFGVHFNVWIFHVQLKSTS